MTPSVQAAPRAIVLISGDDVYEDLFGASSALVAQLSALGFATAARVGLGSVPELASGGRLPDVIVLFTAMGECTPAQQKALSDAVAAGMGLVALHTAVVFGQHHGELADSYRELFELLGSRYASHGPEPHESRFLVQLDPAHPITHGVEPFEVTHEHYRLELASPLPSVLAWRETADGEREPLLHVADHGEGRVAYLQLGHDMRVWNQPSVQLLLTRAIEWAQRRKAIE